MLAPSKLLLLTRTSTPFSPRKASSAKLPFPSEINRASLEDPHSSLKLHFNYHPHYSPLPLINTHFTLCFSEVLLYSFTSRQDDVEESLAPDRPHCRCCFGFWQNSCGKLNFFINTASRASNIPPISSTSYPNPSPSSSSYLRPRNLPIGTSSMLIKTFISPASSPLHPSMLHQNRSDHTPPTPKHPLPKSPPSSSKEFVVYKKRLASLKLVVSCPLVMVLPVSMA